MTTGEPNQFEPDLNASIQASKKLKDIVDINSCLPEKGSKIFSGVGDLYAELGDGCFNHVVCAQIFNILAKYCKEILTERLDVIVRAVLGKYLSILTQSGFRGIVNVIWALARLGYADTDAIGAILDEAVKKVEEAEPQGIANILWATAILGFKDHPIIAISVNKAREMLVKKLFSAEGIMQLYHFNLDTGLLPEADSVFKELEDADKLKINASVSLWELEIISRVKTVFADRSDFDIKTSFKTNGFECDMALIYHDERSSVNIEIDGVGHRVEELTNEFRDRILNKLGWIVVRISYDDIRGRGTDSIADLIKQKLQEAGIPI